MRLLALLILAATASAQDPTLPQEPTIYVVTGIPSRGWRGWSAQTTR